MDTTTTPFDRDTEVATQATTDQGHRVERQQRLLFVVLACAFFTSGFSALLYQVAWQRMLGLFAGSDVRSATIVIGAYLAGLGVGSLLASFITDRLDSRRAVQIFGFCNLGIALFAVLSRLVFYDFLFRTVSVLAASPVVTLVVAFASLLWPTVLMGLSLPLLSKALVSSVRGAAGRISLLYGINTLGSGVGTLLGGWLLLGTLGYDGAGYLGAVLNGLVALTALLIAPRFAAGDRAASVASASRPGLARIPREVWLWCGFVFASGFIAISLELIWFRVLSVLLQPNAYTFAHLLAFILVGYALGSLVGSRVVERIHSPRRAFLVIQALVALYSVGIVLAMYRWYPTLNAYLAASTGQVLALSDLWRPGSPFVFGYVILPAAMLLPPNLLIGAAFPVVQKGVQTDAQFVGQRIGIVQVANILGNTAGSILTGLALLDLVGTAGTLRVAGVLGLLFALVLVVESLRARRIVGGFAGLVLAGALAVVVAVFPGTVQFWARLHGGSQANSYVAEDSSGVSVLQYSAGEGTLYANGNMQSSLPFFGFHGFMGSLPALVHPEPGQALVIGLGTGGTAYGVGVNPSVTRIRAVELIGSELDVIDELVREPQAGILKAMRADWRFDIAVTDGRRELALTDQRFDIIQADATLPWRSYSGMVYSREFFEQALRKLADGGIMAQWRPTQRVEHTFMDVFPYGVNVGGHILLGSNQPIAYDRQAVLARLQDPRVVAYLERGGLDVDQFRTWAASLEPVFWTPDRPRARDVNTDLFPRDEYYLNNPAP